ncbi:MAG TPA: hypothetical protein VF192_13465 [Longimicrobiales bacterium]
MRRLPRPVWLPAAVLLLAPLPGRAQDAAGWDSPRVLALMEAARTRRQLPRGDSALRNYRAHANGYVYFYLDRRDSEERTLVKVDQVALDVYWAAPNRTKQRIVGLRDEKRLPVRIHYHLDHLTVVQNEFGDSIRLGDGDEVRDVPHPAAPGSGAIYQFRLADSLSLYLPGAPDPVRVYEVEVRPRSLDEPAFVGSIFLDRATGAIVRMSFTFTPAAYVDRRLDYIHIALDNGLWQGRYWLPHEQRVEIRRQVPELDFPVGGVIRGVMSIGDYRFNQPLPDGLFRGPPVVAVPEPVRQRFPFPTGLFDGLEAEGLAAASTSKLDLGALRKEALRLVGRRRLSGLPRLRLLLPGASSVGRYDRAEGVFVGAGVSYALSPAARVEVAGGYAAAADRFSGSTALVAELGRTRLRLGAYADTLRDLGPRRGAPGALNTLTAALAGEDFLDPYYATGARLSLGRQLRDRWSARLQLTLEEHRSARLAEPGTLFEDSASFRPVLPISEGTLASGRLAVVRTAPPEAAAGWRAEASLEAGAFEGEAYGRPELDLEAFHRSANRRTELRGRLSAGIAFGAPPAQRLYLLGGAGTLPGYEYRGFIGDRYVLAEVEASHAVIGPWVRLRATAAAGWSDLAVANSPAGWEVAPTGRLRTSVAAGLGLVHDILRVDLARGLNDGIWQVILSVRPDLHDFL